MIRGLPLALHLLGVILAVALDTTLIPLLLSLSVAVLVSDFLISPSHWRDRPSMRKMPRPWEMPMTMVLLYQYHWQIWVHPKPSPDPNTLWP